MNPPPRPAGTVLGTLTGTSAPSGATIGPIRLRRIQPWPTVQRFVVIQYTISPDGKLMMKKTKTNGRPYISMR